jgi:hypothetical protein
LAGVAKVVLSSVDDNTHRCAMRRLDTVRFLASLTLAASLALFAGASRAVVYTSTFDPPDFLGTATFDVSPGCLSAGPGLVANDGFACTVTWLSALVTLLDGPNSASLNYSPAFLPSALAVASVIVQGGELAGVNSIPIGPALVVGNADPDLNGPWWIEYLFGPAGEFGLGIVNLYTGSCMSTESGMQCLRNPVPVSVADVESFARLAEEPQTLALLVAATLVLVSLRRTARGAG